MPSPHEVRRASTPFFSVVLLILGIAILVRTIIAGGAGLTYGIVLGVLFIAAGAGRLWVSRKGLG